VPLPALARWCQMLVTLGGDGTAITGARALAGARGVLLPVNLGALGFLTVAESRELDLAVRKALASEWPVVRRRPLGAVVRSRAPVLAPGAELVLKVLGSFDRGCLLLDGQESVDLHAGDEVVVRLDRVAVNLVQNPDRPFARSLQAKLGWQGSAKRSM